MAKPHWDGTLQKARAENTVICLQDTTELDFNARRAKDLGRVNDEARRIMSFHPTVIVTPGRVQLLSNLF